MDKEEVITKIVDHGKKGRKNRAAGARFEIKVRGELESKGWTVDRWTNTVEFLDEGMNEGKLIPCKPKFNPFTKRIMMNTGGFPDFIATKSLGMIIPNTSEGEKVYTVIGIECKTNGYLSREEKKKCEWLLKNDIFGKIIIAKKGKKRGEIIYKVFGKE